MEPGLYQALVEKSGFVTFPKEPVHVERGSSPIQLQYPLQFGVAPRATLSGRVLSSGKAAASARVVLIRGPGLSFTTLADAEGRFVFVQLDPGEYTLLAEPSTSGARFQSEGPRMEDVPTYFPSSIDEKGAQRIAVRGNAAVDGFQLQTALVFRVRGVVTDNYGKVAAGASVRLMPITPQPAHVELSFGSSFIAIGEGPGPGPEAARVVAGDDGSFEFSAVRAGRWAIAAEAAAAIDPASGFNLAQAGSAALTIFDGDVKDFRVLIADAFTLAGSAAWSIRCVSGALACGQKPAESAVVPIWLRATDGKSSALHVGIVQADGTFRIEHIHAGNYFIQMLPPFLNGRMLMGSLVSWRLGIRGRFVGQAVDLDRGDSLDATFGISLSEGGSVILDVDHPVDRTARHLDAALSGSVRGTVANGGGATVVLFPEQFDSQGARGALVFCQADGTFDAPDLAAGSYRIAAFQGLDMEGLRDPELFGRILATEKKVRVELGATTEVQLEASDWPK
jgi:hypothetical protein